MIGFLCHGCVHTCIVIRERSVFFALDFNSEVNKKICRNRLNNLVMIDGLKIMYDSETWLNNLSFFLNSRYRKLNLGLLVHSNERKLIFQLRIYYKNSWMKTLFNSFEMFSSSVNASSCRICKRVMEGSTRVCRRDAYLSFNVSRPMSLERREYFSVEERHSTRWFPGLWGHSNWLRLLWQSYRSGYMNYY